MKFFPPLLYPSFGQLHFSLDDSQFLSLAFFSLACLSSLSSSISIAMRGAAASLLVSPSARRAWQQHAGSWGMEGILSATSSSISLPSFFSSTSSSSSSPPTPFHLLDRVFVTRMPFFARHGVHPAEAQLGQRFEVDAEVFIDGLAGSVLAEEEGGGKERDESSSSKRSSSKGSKSSKTSSSPSSSVVPADSVSRTFDYSRIHAVAQRVVRDGPRAQLVETLAARIADALLEEENEENEKKGGGKEKETSSSSSSSPFFEVVGARVRVTKPGAPIEGVFGEAGCEVVRWKKGQQRK